MKYCALVLIADIQLEGTRSHVAVPGGLHSDGQAAAILSAVKVIDAHPMTLSLEPVTRIVVPIHILVPALAVLQVLSPVALVHGSVRIDEDAAPTTLPAAILSVVS